jgi:hypothetical protein
MGRRESIHCALLVVVVGIVAVEVVKVVDGAFVVVLASVGSGSVDVVVVGGMAVVQLGPEHRDTLMSAQFQNFSAPLLLVRGSTTAGGHDDLDDPHHASAPPPNLEVIHCCVEFLLKYSRNPIGLQELAVTQNH